MEICDEEILQVQQQNPQTSLPSKFTNIAEDLHQNLKLFIQMYHNLPVLWDTSMKDYNNRAKRINAYEQLLLIYRLLKPNANLSDVKKKINTLRTNYRRMLKTFYISLKSGTEYQPGWTFYELDFLRSAENFLTFNTSKKKRRKKLISSSDEILSQSKDARKVLDNALNHYLVDKENTSSTIVIEMSHQLLGNQNNNFDQMMQVEGTDQRTPALGVPESLQNDVESPINAKQNETSVPLVNTNSPSPQDEILNVACEYLSSTYPEEESIARTWTQKLKRLPKEQRLLAEKFIKDILFEAESGTLYRGCMELHTSQPFVRLGPLQRKYITQDNLQSTNIISATTRGASPMEFVENNLYEVSCPSPVEIKHTAEDDCSTQSSYN